MQILLIMLIVVFLAFSVLLLALAKQSPREKKYNKEDELRIVSCSNVVPVKRLDLIVETLQHILDINIKWTHFGDGIMMNQIKEMSREIYSICG